MLSDIGNYLQTQRLGTLGQNLFLGFLPESPDFCSSLYEYAGSPPALHWDGEYPGLHVKVRADDYATARAQMEAIIRLLHGLSETTLSGTRYLLIKAKGSPEIFERDAKSRVVLFVNFEMIKEVS